MSILIIEDEAEICEIIKEILESHAPNIFQAHSLKAADELFARHTFKLVITDDNVTDGSGFEYVRRKKAEGFQFEVIGMSGKQIKSADFKFFCKPFDLLDLLKTVLYYMKEQRMPVKSFWREALLIHHSMIDRDHQHLVGLISALHNERENGADKDVLIHTLQELKDYCGYHFSREEALMDQREIHEEHRAQHRMFAERIDKFYSNYLAGAVDITEELFDFLFQWLGTHIEQCDKQLAQQPN